MSMFLEILRCILCCFEENQDENEYQRLHGNTSKTIFPVTFGSRSNDSAIFRSTFVNSVERTHNVTSSSNSYTKYESSTKLPQLSSTKLATSSSSTPSRPKPLPSRPKPVSSPSDQPRSLAPEIPSSRFSQSFSSSKSTKVLPSSSKLSSQESSNSITPLASLLKPPTSPSNQPRPLSKFSPSSSSSKLPEILPSSSKLSPHEPCNSINPSASLFTPPISHCKPSPSCTITASSSKTIKSAPLSSLETYLSSSTPPQSVKPASSNASNQQTKAKQKWFQKYELPVPAVQTSRSQAPPSSSKPPPSSKPTLAPAFTTVTDRQTKTNYVWVQKNASPIYMIPKEIQDLIKKDKVPQVLKLPLSISTYKDFFAALLYAEDFYIEKWREFELKGIKLTTQKAAIFTDSYFTEINEKDEKIFVEFEIDAAQERRPFLLSRDFVFAKPSGSINTEPFQGIIYRVVKSTKVLVEFGEDFHYHHYSSCKYDVSFSFNRVCLKRAHQAIEVVMDPSFRNFIFPDPACERIILASSLPNCDHKLDAVERSAIQKILTFKGPSPYVIIGPLSVTKLREKLSRTGPLRGTKLCEKLSSTGLFILETVLKIYQNSQENRVLICAPINNTCDFLTRSLKKYIPESDIFRGNAAFREIDGVPLDILPSCVYKGECFACPPLHQLKKFRVILSTYISSFRLHSEGITAGHFSHIFLVDASSATEPEAMVAIANLANENNAVIVTGEPGNCSRWVRADIARRYGLKISYFERLYNNLAPIFIISLAESECEADDI